MPLSASSPPMAGHTAIVTGASSGVGAATATALASLGAHVVLAVRDVDKGHRVAKLIQGSTEVRPLDLADLASVRAFATDWAGPIDLLVNNAGVSARTLQRTTDGFELSVGVNHLGHFALTNLLLAHCVGRVVTVASQAERAARLDVDDLNWQHRPFRGSRAYNDSKLANLLFTSELQKRLDAKRSPVLAMAAHPGFVATAIYADATNPIARIAVRALAQDADHGARPVMLAATGDLPGNSFTGPKHLAHMRGGAQPIRRSRRAQDGALASRLWVESAELTNTPDVPTPATGPE